MVTMGRIIEFVDGLKLKFWAVLSAFELEAILTMQNSAKSIEIGHFGEICDDGGGE